MEEIYNKMFELAKPFYEKGRVYDIVQIEWMTKEGERIADAIGADKKLLLPLIILHDVGYCVIKENNPNIKDKESKKIHMKAGAKIAEEILERLNYDPELSKKIVHYISVHDNWVLGDDEPFKECLEMALFNDLDFLFAQSNKESFLLHAKSMGLPYEKMHDFWLGDEKLERRPFCCKETKELFEKYMAERLKEIEEYKKSKQSS